MKKDSYKNQIYRTIILLVIAIIGSAFALVNVDGFILPAFMYIVLAFISIGLVAFWSKLGREKDFIGVGHNYMFDILSGIGLGILFIVLQQLNLLNVLLPNIPGSISITDVGKIIIQVIDAMIIEGIFFVVIFARLLDTKLKSFGIDIPLWIAIPVAGLGAGLFHWYAYNLGVGQTWGAFWSAVIVFSIWGYLTFYYYKSVTPIVICHGIINFYNLNEMNSWITFGITNLFFPILNNINLLIFENVYIFTTFL